MRQLLMVSVLVMSAALGFGQKAKVIPLDPGDAAQAKSLHLAADEANKAVTDFDQRIREKYTAASANLGGSDSKPGWELGLEYSENWLFIVPKQWSVSGAGTITVGGTWPSNCGTFAPALTSPAWSTNASN